MTPNFQLMVEGNDIADRVNNSLVEMRLVITLDNAGDYFEVVLDDRDGQIIIPSPGSRLSLKVGYDNA